MTDQARLAVLIDAENVPGQYADAAFAEMATYGALSVKRAYGNWALPTLSPWVDHLSPQAIQPVQQFGWVKRKNASDSALIIDAMDLLYAGHLDGFCLLSSDSDFTRLATRLRESGMTVYGLGERKTVESFVKACDRFVYLEVLPQPTASATSDVPPGLTGVDVPKDAARVPDLLVALTPAIVAAQGDTGWSRTSDVGQHLRRTHADFDPRNYGYRNMREAVNATEGLDVEEIVDPSGAVHVWVRVRKGGPDPVS
ncbi:MAG: NYN domain-containing protein [Nocardioidaceae bacterium]|nr:NYN domain-containing protein [Nocardioidaceae bacterium]